jgi:hypothetical protein
VGLQDRADLWRDGAWEQPLHVEWSLPAGLMVARPQQWRDGDADVRRWRCADRRRRPVLVHALYIDRPPRVRNYGNVCHRLTVVSRVQSHAGHHLRRAETYNVSLRRFT